MQYENWVQGADVAHINDRYKIGYLANGVMPGEEFVLVIWQYEPEEIVKISDLRLLIPSNDGLEDLY